MTFITQSGLLLARQPSGEWTSVLGHAYLAGPDGLPVNVALQPIPGRLHCNQSSLISHDLVNELFEKAKRVLEQPESPTARAFLLEVVADLERAVEEKHTPRARQARAAAEELAQHPHLLDGNDIEVDQETLVYHNADNGWWVGCWMYVSDESLTPESGQDDPTKESTEERDDEEEIEGELVVEDRCEMCTDPFTVSGVGQRSGMDPTLCEWCYVNGKADDEEEEV